MPKHKTVATPNEVVLSKEMYKEANESMLTFSQLLERINPSKDTDTLDAFERQMKRFGIVTKSNPMAGIFASTIAEFLDAKPLETYENQPLQTGVPSSKILFPEYVSRVARTALLKDTDYNVDQIIGATRIIPSTTYKELWIDTTAGKSDQVNTDKYAMARTGEFGTFPRVKIGWSESAKSLFKRGVQIDMSYEFQREATMDILNMVIERIMLSQRIDLFKKAVAVAFNGTTVVQSNTLDAASTTGKLTYEAWLKWTASFAPYSPEVYYMSINTALKVLMMEKPDIDPVQLMASLKQGPVSQSIQVSRGLWKNVTVWPFTDNTLPDDYILTMDKTYALERIIQAGTDLQETERVITQQFDSVVISIADEISKVFSDSIFVLHIHS